MSLKRAPSQLEMVEVRLQQLAATSLWQEQTRTGVLSMVENSFNCIMTFSLVSQLSTISVYIHIRWISGHIEK